MAGNIKKTHNLESLNKEILTVKQKYPTLNILYDKKVTYLQGSFPIHYNEQEIDRFVIRIEIPLNYPRSIPRVWEIGGRIPRILKRHINVRDGSACLFLEFERWQYFPPGSTLIDFLDGPIRSFLLMQCCFEKGISWSHGERSHGRTGIIEYFQELTGVEQSDIIVKLIEYVSKTGKKGVRGHLFCPCGSGKIIRKCHFNELIKIQEKNTTQLCHKKTSIYYSTSNSKKCV